MGFIAERKPRVNKTLISLKFVVFFVISGEFLRYHLKPKDIFIL